MDPKSLRTTAAFVAIAALFAPLASAVDGVIEINQAKALIGGVTPTDGAGFPITIDSGGSYRLTSNLDLAAGGQATPENLTAIFVGVTLEPKFVDIDLNGFTIEGPVTCTFGMNLSCSANATGASGYGINVNNGSLRVHDGAIQGFAQNCIDNSVTGKSIHLRNLDLKWCITGANAHHGVLENINTVQNRGQGLFASRSVLRGIHSQENSVDGISISESTLDDCTSSYNGFDGIEANNGSLVHRCVSFSNGGFGLRSQSGVTTCGYAGNSLFNNAEGDVDNGEQLGSNLCSGVACP